MHQILSPEASTILTLLLYAVAGIAGIGGMIARSPAMRKAATVAAVLGLATQTVALLTGFHGSTRGGLSIGAYLQMLAWFLVLTGTILRIFMKQATPLIFATLLSLILFAFSAPTLSDVVVVNGGLKGSFYALHIGSLFSSLALIATAAAAGAAFIWVEARIKQKLRLPSFVKDMPALDILDRINALATVVGFPLFTLGIVSGLIYAGPAFGGTLTGDPKEVVSIFAWILFGMLFHNRLSRGWRGRKPARLIMLVFAVCVLSIVIVNFFMVSHHAFVRS